MTRAIGQGGGAESRFNPRAMGERRPEGPRKVRNGIKLQSKPPFAPRTALAQRWLKLLEEHLACESMQHGAEYARLGQTLSMETSAGLIEGKVQGRAARAYRVRISFPPIAPEQWDRLIEAMSHEAVYLAKLMAGELPPAIDDLFNSSGASLVPAAQGLILQCDCPDTHPCKHAATLGYLVAEQLEVQPLSILTLLGLSAERIIDRLRHARAADISGAASNRGNGGSAHADPMIPESQVEPPPLEQCLDDFWRTGPRLAELNDRPHPHHVPHALLRRLGPSPMNGKFPMVGLLASIYDTVAEAAKEIRDKHDSGDSQPGNQ